MEEDFYNREKELPNAEKQFYMTNEGKNETAESDFTSIPSFSFCLV